MYRYLKLSELQKGFPCLCEGSYPTPQAIPNYKELFGEDCVEFFLEDNVPLPERLILGMTSTTRGAESEFIIKVPTEFEKFKIDGEKYVIPENYYFKKNSSGIILDIVEKPAHNFIHPLWNEDYCIWVETATDEEIVNFDSARTSEVLLMQERDLKAQVSLGRATRSFKDYTKEKQDMKFKKEESYRFQQAGADFLSETISFENYEEIKNYMDKLLKGEEVTRPAIMSKYDPAPITTQFPTGG